jgi:hypothetical protein
MSKARDTTLTGNGRYAYVSLQPARVVWVRWPMRRV